MKKSLIFIYGIICYAIFLISFLYAIPFIGDFWVSKTVNTGTQTPVIQAVIINLVLLSLFAIQHTIMARQPFKKWLTQYIPWAMERSTFVLLSSLILLLLYWQWRPIPGVIWEVENQFLSGLIYAIFAIGWLIVFLSTFMINHFDLFGLKQVYEYLRNIEPQPPKFRVRYFYRFVRHPIMTGFIIAFWASPVMTTGHLLFAAVTTVYIIIAVKFLEEKDLERIHGEKYREYKEKVPMLIPH